ncbi:hypothetical protein ACLBVF_10380 [Pseudomonas aeruginosa]|uniref:hypothetical protein n=1 Tax=Pseudomonas aeruginosa TaxID=287 RepID=UPI0039682D11
MERIELNIGGKDFVFAVDFEDDYDAGAPWEMADGHGPVTGWERLAAMVEAAPQLAQALAALAAATGGK